MNRDNEALNLIMSELADELNISETMEKKAVSGYENVGSWLDSDDFDTRTVVYPQGSFALGTVIKPLSGDDEKHEYDIDLVCYMPEMENNTAEEVKRSVGERLQEHKGHADKLDDEGKRCWTLHYAGFHMDILPSTTAQKSEGGPYPEDALRITEKGPQGAYSFRSSNPKGYKKWFEGRMGRTLNEERSRVAGKITCSVEEVHLYQARTTLQRVVQILKHHRDVMLENDPEIAPISIILTTLAARAYDQSEGVFDALCHILAHMDEYVENRNGIWHIDNPVAPGENFADKWELEPAKAQAFFRWLEAARSSLVTDLIAANGLDELAVVMEKSLGSVYPKRAIGKYGASLNERRRENRLFSTAGGLSTIAGSTSKVVPNHSFYGRG